VQELEVSFSFHLSYGRMKGKACLIFIGVLEHQGMKEISA
jgi:hypothetical protein